MFNKDGDPLFDNLDYSVPPGSIVNFRNISSTATTIKVSGEHGTEVEFNLPPGGLVKITAGVENLKIESADTGNSPGLRRVK